MSKWWEPSKSADIQPIPWLSPNAVAKLESILTPEFEVVEHGSGGSTLWFAERVKHVTAFENDADWQMIVKSKAPQNVSINGQTKISFYDVLLIDGVPVEERAQWILQSVDIVKRGGWVVLDNSNRPEYEKEREWLKSVCDEYESINGNENGTKYLVTDFFRLK